jgi:hypothetical protein
MGVKGTIVSLAPSMIEHVDSGTSFQAPARSPSGSEATSRDSSETSRRYGLSGYWARSVATSVL